MLYMYKFMYIQITTILWFIAIGINHNIHPNLTEFCFSASDVSLFCDLFSNVAI